MVRGKRTEGASERFWRRIPIFHIPIFGGWRDYVVLKPHPLNQDWHVGWISGDVTGVTRITLHGPVRMLLGQEGTSFFGVSADSGEQIELRRGVFGKIGSGGRYVKLPLL